MVRSRHSMTGGWVNRTGPLEHTVRVPVCSDCKASVDWAEASNGRFGFRCKAITRSTWQIRSLRLCSSGCGAMPIENMRWVYWSEALNIWFMFGCILVVRAGLTGLRLRSYIWGYWCLIIIRAGLIYLILGNKDEFRCVAIIRLGLIDLLLLMQPFGSDE